MRDGTHAIIRISVLLALCALWFYIGYSDNSLISMPAHSRTSQGGEWMWYVNAAPAFFLWLSFSKKRRSLYFKVAFYAAALIAFLGGIMCVGSVTSGLRESALIVPIIATAGLMIGFFSATGLSILDFLWAYLRKQKETK